MPAIPRVDWKRHSIWPVAVGDIVIYGFPLKEGQPGKGRPSLVLAVHPRVGRPSRLTLAYGTDVERRANRGFEVSLRRENDFLRAGLRKGTRFICARRATVSADDDSFRLGPDGTPVVGRLPGELLKRLEGLLPLIDLARDQPGGASGGGRPRRRVGLRESSQAEQNAMR